MKTPSQQRPSLLLVALSLPAVSHGFAFHGVAPGRSSMSTISPFPSSPTFARAFVGPLHAVADRDEEIERLRGMAAKLRAEAATLEAEQAQIQAEATARLFEKFDLDKDGEISVSELKVGLEKVLKTELSDRRVQKLFENFDKSADGALQLSEFATVEQLRNKLDAIARDEKQAALELSKQAKLEEEAVKLIQAQLEVLNDRPPTAADKLLSILPYLFPLLDALPFARFLVLENPDNPVSIAIAVLFSLYRAIPFGGFIAFFALNFLSGNPSINRLIRFNMQQAIYLDIALFFPGLLAAVYGLLSSGLGFQVPQSVTELGSDAVFAAIILAIGYSAVSSLLGITPDKIPLIGNAVSGRMPTMDMFDPEGRFLGRPRNNGEDDKDPKDEKKNKGD